MAVLTPPKFRDHDVSLPGHAPGFEKRRPLIYNHATHEVHVGPYESLHMDIEQIARNGSGEGALSRGWIGPNVDATETDHHHDQGGQMGWYSGGIAPSVPEHVTEAVKKRFDIDEEKGYHFAHATRKSPGGPGVFEHTPEDFDDFGGFGDFEEWVPGQVLHTENGRKPVIYSPTLDEIHIGPVGSTHSELAEFAPGLDEVDLQNSPSGWVGFNHESPDDKPHGWYGEHPGAHVDKALGDHYGVTPGKSPEYHFAHGAILPHEFRLGEVSLKWEEIDPGVIFIQASEGTVEDRAAAHTFIRAKLSRLGYEHAQFEVEPDKSTAKTAHWDPDNEEIVMVRS